MTRKDLAGLAILPGVAAVGLVYLAIMDPGAIPIVTRLVAAEAVREVRECVREWLS